MRYDEALPMADTHVFLKHACKEIAYGLGKSLTFMAKWDYAWAGSSSHIHQSLWSADGKTAACSSTRRGDHGMSDMMKHYVAGQLEHAERNHLFPCALISTHTSATWLAPLRLPAPCGALTTARRVTVCAVRNQSHPHGMPRGRV